MYCWTAHGSKLGCPTKRGLNVLRRVTHLCAAFGSRLSAEALNLRGFFHQTLPVFGVPRANVNLSV